MLITWLLCSAAFGFGYILRGLLSLRDVETMDRLEAQVAQLEKEQADLNDLIRSTRWAKRQGLI